MVNSKQDKLNFVQLNMNKSPQCSLEVKNSIDSKFGITDVGLFQEMCCKGSNLVYNFDPKRLFCDKSNGKPRASIYLSRGISDDFIYLPNLSDPEEAIESRWLWHLYTWTELAEFSMT